jgi:crossover junction endodeoxyribonuclease RusA
MALTIISLPWPAKALSPNHRSRSHWPRTRALKKARETAWALTLEAKASGTLLTVTFNPPDKQPRDKDNLIASTKAYQDGISDALRCDDSTFDPEYHIGNPVKGGRVVVEIGNG